MSGIEWLLAKPFHIVSGTANGFFRGVMGIKSETFATSLTENLQLLFLIARDQTTGNVSLQIVPGAGPTLLFFGFKFMIVLGISIYTIQMMNFLWKMASIKIQEKKALHKYIVTLEAEGYTVNADGTLEKGDKPKGRRNTNSNREQNSEYKYQSDRDN